MIGPGKSRRGPELQLSASKMLTIIILFYLALYRNFKYFYQHTSIQLRRRIPKLISCSRFVSLIKDLFMLLLAYMFDKTDSTTSMQIKKKNKVLKDLARTKKIFIEGTRRSNPFNFLVNLVDALVPHHHRKKKRSLNFGEKRMS